MNTENIRVRFAPSPTGPLHIGGVRTALYNYLFAKKHGGKMILRIEDTDQTRFVPGAEKYIIEAFEWLGIKFDEGVHVGGPYKPYKQSERKESYRVYAEDLISNGYAYYAFDTPEELDTMRKKLEEAKVASQYNAQSRKEMKNSLTLSDDEVKILISKGEPYVIRLKIPENEDIIFNDLIRGEVIVNSSTLDDKVLFKSDGMPTYHLANVVDDHAMKISHVIRGEEWLPSAPTHYLLYKYLGWIDNIPEFAHLPLLLKPDGNGKLSKRDGDRLGFPVFPLQWQDPKTNDVSSGYRESGYFPDAVVNILAFLGWNSGTEQEIFSMDELCEAFSFDRVNKAGAKFDHEKAKWYNQQYLRTKSDEEIANLFKDVLNEKSVKADDITIINICSLVKERAAFVNEIWDNAFFFFQDPEDYDRKIIKKRWKDNTAENLIEIKNMIEKIQDFIAEKMESGVKSLIAEKELNMGQIMNCLRLCMVGAGLGPDLFKIMEILGKEKTLLRLETGIQKIEEIRKA